VITDNETVCEHSSQRDIEAISRQIQQGVWDCTSNPLVPKAFQMPVESHSLVTAIESIAQVFRVFKKHCKRYLPIDNFGIPTKKNFSRNCSKHDWQTHSYPGSPSGWRKAVVQAA